MGNEQMLPNFVSKITFGFQVPEKTLAMPPA